MVSNEFWVCECDVNNLHIIKEMRCQMCGVWGAGRTVRRVRVEDVVDMVYKYTAEGVRMQQLKAELNSTWEELNHLKTALNRNPSHGYQPVHEELDLSNPPTGGSGVLPKPVEPCNILFNNSGDCGEQPC